MTGRPRSQRAERLALFMAGELRNRGPQRVEVMLDAFLCGPSYWEQMETWERAASRMAVGRLICVWGARLDVDGRLYLPEQKWRRAA